MCFLSVFLIHGQGNVEKFEGRGSLNNGQIVLDLSSQNLTEIPIQANNPEIEILILDNNRIEKIPNWIGQLDNLKVLSIQNNNLTEVNDMLFNCKQLEQLYLKDNPHLSELPSLSDSNELKIIDVTNTNISYIPMFVRLLPNLFYYKYTEK